MSLSWEERIQNYNKQTGYPNSLFIAGDGRNDYRVKSGYYGGYPATYLKRLRALFPDAQAQNTLHLFSGKVDTEIFPGDTVDLNGELNPTYIDDSQSLENVPLEKHSLILSDPPYSSEDVEHYGTTMVSRIRVFKALQKTVTGTYICWLDQVLPMYRKDFFSLEAIIGIVKSTNHRFRVLTIFKRR